MRMRATIIAGLLDTDPDYPFARGNRLFCRLQFCDWRSLAEEERGAFKTAMRAGKRVIAPFDAKALFLSAEDELACARIWAADQHARPPAPHSPRQRSERSAIRVAYISADFREGPLGTLMTGVFERHDQHKIETIGVSLGPDDGSAMRRRFEQAFGQFVDAGAKSDHEIASLLREMEIDIAVDLMGFTEGGRSGIFKHRPAPIQVNYLGYPGTVGRRLARLPDRRPRRRPGRATPVLCRAASSICRTAIFREIRRANPRRRRSRAPTRDCRRQASCSPASTTRTSSTRSCSTSGCACCARSREACCGCPRAIARAMQNLAREADARGVAPDRLVFAPFRKSPEQHLARLQLADLFLDTLPYNAHTTASDALWAGRSGADLSRRDVCRARRREPSSEPPASRAHHRVARRL